MSTKLDLIQKLLLDRDEVIVLHGGKAFCSCGAEFYDDSDIENHLVYNHEKLSANSSRKSLPLILKDVIKHLSKQPEAAKENVLSSEQQLDIELPAQTIAVCLDEDDIGGGHLGNINCHECSVACYSFKTLKDHYLRQHPGSWANPDTCHHLDRILFQKPSKEFSPKKMPSTWSFHYYCPLPGCKYHVGQHRRRLEDDHLEAKFFSSYSLLKQHYSKMHAHRSRICEKCGAGFATEVYLRRHKKLACGRSFGCRSCKAIFSALENLQTHCRRKGHQPSLELCKKKEKEGGGGARTIVALKPVLAKKDPSLASKDYYGSSKYVKIAPMPSLTMTAALALSELSTKEPLASSSSAVEAPRPKNQHDLAVMVDTKESNSSSRGDKLLWSAARSTQTSPRGEDQIPEISPDESILKPSACSSRSIPKLGEIEQFSTETQTDDLELLLKPNNATAAAAVTSHQNEDAFTIEAQTQFDLDDILCSNYTQTALFDTSLDQNSVNVGAAVNSAETQTMLMSYDLVNMETQTMSMLFDSAEEVNS